MPFFLQGRGTAEPQASQGEGSSSSRKPDRYHNHYRHEFASPFALSKECEMERAGAGWASAAPGDADTTLAPATDRGPVWRAKGGRDPLQPKRPGSGGWDARSDSAAPGDEGPARPKQGWAVFQDAADWARKPAQTQAMDRPRVMVAKADHKHHQNGALTERPRSPMSRTPDRPSVVGADFPLPTSPSGLGHPLSLAGEGQPPRQRKQGEGRGPLILAHRVGSHRLVHAVCPQAQALGVTVGMTVAAAQLLSPGMAVEDADLAADSAALKRAARWAAGALSPLSAPDPPDGLLLDVTGLTHLHGGEAAMLERFVAAFAVRGVRARAAVADTTGAAWGWARFGPGGVLPVGGQSAALGPLPVAALRLPAGTVDALSAVGVDTIAELAALPRGPAARRYGSAVLQRLDQALGHAPEPIDPVAPPRRMAAELKFPEPFTTAEPLTEAARRLLADLAARLALGGLGARSLKLSFLRVDGAAQTIGAGTARPSRDAAHLMRLLAPKLETVDPGFGIEAATLVALRVEPLRPVQLGGEAAAEDGMAELIDRLLNRPETARVARPSWRESDWPERCVGWASPLPAASRVAAPQARTGEGRATSWPAALPRPPRLIHPPQPVDAIAMLPDHPPVRFTWGGRHHRVVRADGPERLHAEWWRGLHEEGQVRDYFQVEDEAGQRFWLFRAGDGEDPATGDMRWWLQGVFG